MTNELPKHLINSDVDTFDIERVLLRGKASFTRKGKKLKSEEAATYAEYGIPNTWTEVRICPESNGHILAMGYDGSGKLQYLYHPDYLQFRNQLKFRELHRFARLLPKIRRRVNRDLKREDWDERKLLALTVKILDKHHLRIGSRVYAKKNQSYGLTTLRKKHLHETESGLRFEYQGKSGQERSIELTDPDLVEHIKECVDFPGWEVFSIHQAGHKVKANAQSVNDYIREISHSDFSARNFRTWAATSWAVKLLPAAQREVKADKRKQLIPSLVALVADRLGNTPAICREYYIHPKVLNKLGEEHFDPRLESAEIKRLRYMNKHEKKALEILEASQ